MEGDIVEELGQFLDVGLLGYQFVIPSFPFSPQLVNYQGQVSIHFEQFDVKVNCRLDSEGACLVCSHIIRAIETQSCHKGDSLIVGRDQSRPNPMA